MKKWIGIVSEQDHDRVVGWFQTYRIRGWVLMLSVGWVWPWVRIYRHHSHPKFQG